VPTLSAFAPQLLMALAGGAFVALAIDLEGYRGQVRHRRRNSGRQSSSPARRGMGHFYGFLGWRNGRTSKLCCANLWWAVWNNAGHSGKAAAHFFSVGARRTRWPSAL
jgi:hypothetical protein